MAIIYNPRSRRKLFNWHWFVSLIMLSGISACQVSFPWVASRVYPTDETYEPLLANLSPIVSTPTGKTAISANATPQPTAKRRETNTASPTITVIPSGTLLPFSSGPLSIGSSAGGRSLEVYRFGNGNIIRMIIAGIHGGYEWNTIELAFQLIEQIKQHPELIPVDKTLYILPTFNPDGEARGHGAVGRANDNGVDLNRNFSENWKLDWARTGCWQLEPIKAGKYPFSEPESSALANFLGTHPVDALISYHSAGKGIYPGGRSFHLASNNLASTLASVSVYPYPGFDTGCEITGMLVDYAAASGIAAVDLELTTHWDTELESNLAVLQAFLVWSFEQ